MGRTVLETANEVLEVVPLVMRGIRAKLREQRATEISVPQFRALIYLRGHDGASLSDLAVHIGLTLPSMSKLVDGLVNRELVSRDAHHTDRRRVRLALTARGREALDEAYRDTQKFLAGKLSGLPREDLEAISRAMEVLRRLSRAESEVDRASEAVSVP